MAMLKKQSWMKLERLPRYPMVYRRLVVKSHKLEKGEVEDVIDV